MRVTSCGTAAAFSRNQRVIARSLRSSLTLRASREIQFAVARYARREEQPIASILARAQSEGPQAATWRERRERKAHRFLPRARVRKRGQLISRERAPREKNTENCGIPAQRFRNSRAGPIAYASRAHSSRRRIVSQLRNLRMTGTGRVRFGGRLCHRGKFSFSVCLARAMPCYSSPESCERILCSLQLMNKGYTSNELYFRKRPHGTHSRPRPLPPCVYATRSENSREDFAFSMVKRAPGLSLTSRGIEILARLARGSRFVISRFSLT